LDQTIHAIEIIIVNDGSTDDSLKIIEEFEKNDHRVILINSENKGVSHARNLGMTKARGTYIGFADADDFIDPEMYSSFYKSIMNNDADMAICNVRVHGKNGTESDRFSFKDEKIDLTENRKIFLNDFFDFRYDYANWNKLYKKSIINAQHLNFHQDMKIWEDFLFNLMYLSNATKIVILSESFYHYQLHESSTMSRSNSILVEQYNLLFQHYFQFCKAKGIESLFLDFNYKMAEGVYNNLFPRLSKEFIEGYSFFTSIRMKSKLLSEFTPGMLQFNLQLCSGYQKFKKKLLMSRKFTLFALVDSIVNIILNE
jgi:glycosyltransferase involved in cell wall biosynthesis